MLRFRNHILSVLKLHGGKSHWSIVLIFNLLAVLTYAQSNTLQIYCKNGAKESYSFDSHPKIMLDKDSLTVKTSVVTFSYPIDNLQKYTVNESEDAFDSHTIVINDGETDTFINENTVDNCDILYNRNFVDTNWQAFYVPFSTKCSDFEDVEFALINNFHQYDDDNDGLLDRTELEIYKADENDILYPNYPYLIRAKQPGYYSLCLKNTTLYATCSNSIDCSSVEMNYILTGTYQTIDNIRSKGMYYLENGFLVRPVSGLESLQPFRWYLTMSSRGSQTQEQPIVVNSQQIKLTMLSDGENSSIKGVSKDVEVQSVYDLKGRKSNTPSSSGVYIVRSKNGATYKVIMK